MRFVVTLAVALLAFASSPAPAAGFRQIDVPDPPGRPLIIGIWFPSSVQTTSQPVGPFQQNVALNATIKRPSVASSSSVTATYWDQGRILLFGCTILEFEPQ